MRQRAPTALQCSFLLFIAVPFRLHFLLLLHQMSPTILHTCSSNRRQNWSWLLHQRASGSNQPRQRVLLVQTQSKLVHSSCLCNSKPVPTACLRVQPRQPQRRASLQRHKSAHFLLRERGPRGLTFHTLRRSLQSCSTSFLRIQIHFRNHKPTFGRKTISPLPFCFCLIYIDSLAKYSQYLV